MGGVGRNHEDSLSAFGGVEGGGGGTGGLAHPALAAEDVEAHRRPEEGSSPWKVTSTSKPPRSKDTAPAGRPSSREARAARRRSRRSRSSAAKSSSLMSPSSSRICRARISSLIAA